MPVNLQWCSAIHGRTRLHELWKARWMPFTSFGVITSSGIFSFSYFRTTEPSRTDFAQFDNQKIEIHLLTPKSSVTFPVIKPLLERDLYHRTITSHFKRHKIYGYRRTGLHAGIWTSGNHWWSPWNLRIQNGLSIHNKTENERNSEKK